MKKDKGFTLVELMVAVAVVGVLAAVAIPSYKNYIIKAKLSEAIAAMGPCKLAVTEGLQTRDTMPNDWNQWGCEINLIGSNQVWPGNSQYVAAVVTDQYGGIGVELWNVAPELDRAWISLVPVDSTGTNTPALGTTPFRWVCGNQYHVGQSTVGTTVPLKYLPASCRG